MDSEQSSFNPEMEEFLAEAVDRLEAGESLPAILASYPSNYRAELKSSLTLIGGIEEVGRSPLPARNRDRQAKGREAVMAQAANFRAEIDALTDSLAALSASEKAAIKADIRAETAAGMAADTPSAPESDHANAITTPPVLDQAPPLPELAQPSAPRHTPRPPQTRTQQSI